ncbi:MAG: hypothetical protein AAF514_19800, partial [Verrucomicrobiota bacterium]
MKTRQPMLTRCLPALAAGLVCLTLAGPLQAQDDGRTYEIQFPATELRLVLNMYEEVTGKMLIKDQAILEVPVTIETSKKLNRQEWIDYMESALLLNGVALVPAGNNVMKVVNYANKPVQNLGVPIFTDPADFPDGEQVITYIMSLDFIPTSDAAAIFDGVVRLNSTPYASVTEVPNASVIIITENVQIIRQLIKLKEKVDVQPATTTTKIFTLVRADAEEVANSINEILQQQQEARNQSSSSRGGTRTTRAATQNRANNAAALPPGVNAPTQAANTGATGGRAQGVISTQAIVYADARTNRIFVIGHPLQIT